MASERTVRLGMIGCGTVARWHARALQNVPEVQLVACCDLTLEHAQAYAERHGVPHAYAGLPAMLTAGGLDAVLVATWPTAHAEQIAQCVDAGVKFILCEKALAMTGAEAYDIFRRVTAAGTTLLEGYTYRHHPRMATLAELLARRWMTPIDCVHASFSAHDLEHDVQPGAASPQRDWRRRAEHGGGVPFDFTCYCVSAANTLIRALPTRVTALGSISSNFNTIRRLYGLIEYDASPVAIIESSKGAVTQDLLIRAPAATVYVPAMWSTPAESEIVVRHSVDWGVIKEERIALPAAKVFENQLRHFAQVVRGEATPVLPLTESAVNTYAIAALVESVRSGQPVDIHLPDDLVAAWQADHP